MKTSVKVGELLIASPMVLRLKADNFAQLSGFALLSALQIPGST